jgi:type IV pilus assembly protein PilA
MKRKQRGFSLIELLIVVAIILIIAAMAIPSLLHARIAADEASAVNSIRSINTAEISYQTAFPSIGYAAALTNLGGPAPCTPSPTSACLLDNTLASASPGNGSKSGYVFAATGLTPVNNVNTQYTIGTAPLTFNMSGIRNFCSNEDGVIRYNPGSSGSTPVNNTAACQSFTVMP